MTKPRRQTRKNSLVIETAILLLCLRAVHRGRLQWILVKGRRRIAEGNPDRKASGLTDQSLINISSQMPHSAARHQMYSFLRCSSNGRNKVARWNVAKQFFVQFCTCVELAKICCVLGLPAWCPHARLFLVVVQGKTTWFPSLGAGYFTAQLCNDWFTFRTMKVVFIVLCPVWLVFMARTCCVWLMFLGLCTPWTNDEYSTQKYSTHGNRIRSKIKWRCHVSLVVFSDDINESGNLQPLGWRVVWHNAYDREANADQLPMEHSTSQYNPILRFFHSTLQSPHLLAKTGMANSRGLCISVLYWGSTGQVGMLTVGRLLVLLVSLTQKCSIDLSFANLSRKKSSV